MNLNVNTLIIIIIILAYFCLLLVGRIFLNKFSTLEQIFIRNNKRLSTILSLMKGSFDGSIESLRSINELKQNLLIENKESFENNPTIRKIEKEEIRNLGRKNDITRKEATVYLGMIGSPQAREAIEQALLKETDYSVKIYHSNSLTDIHDPSSLPVMIEALLGSHRWYRTRAISNILDFGAQFHPHFLRLRDTREIAWIELLIKYAGKNFTDDTKAFLFNFVDKFELIKTGIIQTMEKQADTKRKYNRDYLQQDMEDLLTLACRTLSDTYFTDFGQPAYYNSPDPIIRRNAYWALSRSNETENFKLLLSRMNEEKFAPILISLLTRMIENNARFLYLVEDAFQAESDPVIKGRLSQVLANRVEYYVLQLDGKNAARAEEILAIILQNNRVNELIGMINLNKDPGIDERLARVVAQNIDPNSITGIDLRTNLKADFVLKAGFEPLEVEKTRKVHMKEDNLIRAMLISIVLGFLLVPTIFIIRYFSFFSTAGWLNLITRYVVDFNYYLIFYSLLMTLSSLGLILLANRNVRKQARLWNLKNISMLFRNQMIPSISIVAPAFNEEKTIVASVRSLLNLRYPNYEVIVVNDGSHDDTLRRLIETFHLIRSDYYYTISLPTSPIRGIYRNPSYPNLVVVDKSNGGKADSLNAGINVANKSYYCGIDSDSLLEPESLLKLASLTLDKSVETPALGGNILPINSCDVENGQIIKKRVPKNTLASLQTIEYLRAFMIGRLGWQQINSLLIISGAFGLFRKDRIIEIGGYLTSYGKYHKDTVGEDMELVVRISRMLNEMKHKFEILYAFNANCWTEVPEDLKSLRVQRFRWQRGLVDILYYHRKMMFNRNYGSTGMLTMPYFLIFETLGPLFEIQGYILILAASLLGVLDVKIALMLFIASVMLGVINSLVALLVAEHEEQFFSIGDLSRMILLAIIENFGPRQWVSFWRVLGEFNVVFNEAGWGKLKRKGI